MGYSHLLPASVPGFAAPQAATEHGGVDRDTLNAPPVAWQKHVGGNVCKINMTLEIRDAPLERGW